MEFVKNGSMLTPTGFRAGSSYCGLKRSCDKLDIAVLAAERDVEMTVAGVFTQNRFAAAPVKWCRSILPSDSIRAIAVNSGNANACTGEQGQRDAELMAETVAQIIGSRKEQVAVASTGIIGVPLPMDRVKTGLISACSELSDGFDAAENAAKAIMTTDTRPKYCALTVNTDQGKFSIGGMVKGAGMIAPDMATMLAFITTDVSAESADLRDVLTKCNSQTFNRISIDGDTSTNDSVFLAASGSSGLSLKYTQVKNNFRRALLKLMEYLAFELVRDGEGATKVIRVEVVGAGDNADAEKAARSVANSLLVKCAVNGEDPNWGRIICACGYSGADFLPEQVSLHIGETQILSGGMPTGKSAAAGMKEDVVTFRIALGEGSGKAVFHTCDMSKQYVELNADYHT